MTWTRAECDLLRDLYGQGKTAEYIAIQLVKSAQAVRQKASRLGLKRSAIPRIVDPSQTGDSDRCTLSSPLCVVDIASRIAKLLKNEISEEVGIRRLTDSELLGYCNSLEGLQTFLRDLCRVDLQDYQLTIAERLLGSRPLVCVTGRQVGKDFTIACFSLWESITRANSKTLVVSAAQRQSDLLNDRILAFIAGNDQLYASVEKSGREQLVFKNHSSIWFLPGTGLVRGFSEATRAFFNEARDLPEWVYDSITPALSRRNGQLAVFSTPLGCTGRLWDLWSSPLYEKIQIRSDQNKYLDRAFLETERDRMSGESYRCEYEGAFIAGQTTFYDSTSIQRACQDYPLLLQPEEGWRYSIGCDWARTVDSSVIIVLGGFDPNKTRSIGQPQTIGGTEGAFHAVPVKKAEPGVVKAISQELKVQYIRIFENTSFDDQLLAIKHVIDVFRPFRLVSEANGLGLMPTETLKKQYGQLIEAFQTNSTSKLEICNLLRSRLERGEIVIPAESTRLRHELEMYEYQVLASSVRLGGPQGTHDDTVIALCLANWAFTHKGPDSARFQVIHTGRVRY